MSTVLAPTKTEAPTYRDVYLLAADLIEECGWNQGSYGDERHGYCIAGAVANAHLFLMGRRASENGDSLKDLLLPFWNGTESPACWNDRADRTRDEVLAKLRTVAEVA